MHRRPPRVPGFAYAGHNAVFLTGTTFGRTRAFENIDFARDAASQILRCADRHAVEDTAHVFMPDHVHVLFVGLRDDADVLAAWRDWRQITAFRWKRATGQRLWQEGYWDRVLREDEESLGVAAYIVHNPVRAGLVERLDLYPHFGSSRYSIQELMEAVQTRPG